MKKNCRDLKIHFCTKISLNSIFSMNCSKYRMCVRERERVLLSGLVTVERTCVLLKSSGSGFTHTWASVPASSLPLCTKEIS